MTFQTYFTATAGFEAARQLDALPPAHRAHGLHGHSFLASVRCALPPGWAHFAGGEVAQLRRSLLEPLGPLDYRLLNDTLDHPDDEALARYLRARLSLPGAAQLSLRSAPRQGLVLDAAGQAQVWRRYRFESAHWLPKVPTGHPCGRLHGHGFEVVLHTKVDGQDGANLQVDAMDTAWAPLQALLDQVCLNDLPGLDNPTSEWIARWLWQDLTARLPGLTGVTVHETGSCGAHFDGQHFRIWKALTLDSAVQLRRAPEGHALRRVHGHSYLLRLHLCAPLDEVLGWTVDYGDVKQRFQPLFQALDHHPLHQIAGLADADTATLAGWILRQALPSLPALNRVDLEETPGCGVIVLADQANLCGAI